MAGTGLLALYKLHLVDSALNDIKQHAGALDLGKAEAAKIKELEADPEGTLTESRKLSVELKDLELEQKSLDDKLKKLDSDLYSGKIVNPREVANIEKEKANIHELRGKIDGRILELWDLVPPAKERASDIEGKISALKETIAKKQAAAKSEHERMQAEFKAKASLRPALTKNVPPLLLTQYEKLREKLGVGMALVTNEHRCSVCGMHVPEKAFAFIIEDKVMQCENCRRILFRLEPA
jgi:predicted  nucleic acid-binding Zn-ribbon protein